MDQTKRFKVVHAEYNHIKIEDALGVRQKDNTLPKVDYFGTGIGKDIVVGDWVDIYIRRRLKPNENSQK